MANTYKDIIITPNRSSDTADPNISFRGGNTASNTEIMLRVYPDANGTLSFEGSAGQLFSVTNDLTNTIFSVNDVSGIPSLEIDANGFVEIAAFGGNVGIGEANTSNISSKLYVAGNMNVTNSITTATLNVTTANVTTIANTGAAGVTVSGTLNTATANITTIVTGNALTLSTGTASNGNIIFSSNGTEDMRITNTGFIGISTTTPNSNLTVVGNVWVTTGLNVETINVTTVNAATLLTRNGINVSAAALAAYDRANTGATVTNDTTTNSTYYPVFTISTSGAAAQNVSSTKLTFNPSTGTLSATIFNALSDREAKKNIRNLGYGLDSVLSMEGKKFELKVSNETSIGFIAQDLEKIVPEVVIDHGDGYKGVNYGVIVAILVEAIKELNAKIEKLENAK